jgi:hypothetical protein
MKSFNEWLENREVSNFVSRIDAEKRDFGNQSNNREFYITRDGESGPTSARNEVPNWAQTPQGPIPGSFKSGIFAGKYHNIVSYLIPRKMPWILVPTKPKKTLYIRQQDVQVVKDYKPWISTFKKTDFEELGREGQGEFFTEKPPTAHKQAQVKNTWRLLQNNFLLKPVSDILSTHKQLMAQNIGFDAEGEIFV